MFQEDYIAKEPPMVPFEWMIRGFMMSEAEE